MLVFALAAGFGATDEYCGVNDFGAGLLTDETAEVNTGADTFAGEVETDAGLASDELDDEKPPLI